MIGARLQARTKLHALLRESMIDANHKVITQLGGVVAVGKVDGHIDILEDSFGNTSGAKRLSLSEIHIIRNDKCFLYSRGDAESAGVFNG